MAEGTAPKTEDSLSTDTTAASGFTTHSNGSGLGAGAFPGNSLNGFDEILVKTEPESGGSTPACLQSPPLSSGSTSGAKAPPSSLPFAPSSSSSATASASNGRLGRSFSTPEPKRKCRGSTSHSSPLLEDENDLKLKPYDFLNNVIKTPPLKPLEEGDDPPITPSPTSMGPLVRRPASNPPNHSNPPSTPTATGIGNTSASSQMAEDLNEFYRVYEKVRLSATSDGAGGLTSGGASTSGAPSTQIDMYSSSISPPPAGPIDAGRGSATRQILSPPPPYSAAPTGEMSQRSSYRSGGGRQLQHMTSPTKLSISPPFTAASGHSLYSGRALVSQPPHVTGQALSLHQHQAQSQTYPSSSTHTPMTRSEVDLSLHFSDPASLQAHQQTRPPSLSVQSQQRGAVAQQCLSLQHQSMQLSHLGQDMVPCLSRGTAVPPTSLTNPATSRVYYNGSQSQQTLKMHTSAPLSLPPQPPVAPPSQHHQTPLTPTTPLGHFSTHFPVSHSSRVSPTHHNTNPLHHQTLPGGSSSYTYTSDASHVLSNHGHAPYLPPAVTGRTHLHLSHQHSDALTVSGHSRPATHQLLYKDTMMAAQHSSVALGHAGSLTSRMQQPSSSMSLYPQHLRMGQISSLQHHAAIPAPPPAYLQSTTHHANTAAFSGLPFQ